jgi:hypothetical protein
MESTVPSVSIEEGQDQWCRQYRDSAQEKVDHHEEQELPEQTGSRDDVAPAIDGFLQERAFARCAYGGGLGLRESDQQQCDQGEQESRCIDQEYPINMKPRDKKPR